MMTWFEFSHQSRRLRVSRLAEEVATATAKINDIEMYYEEHGSPSAEPVVLIMGFGLSCAAWAPQIAPLSERYRVVAFDNRGAGRTSQPPGAYTIPQMAEDTRGLLDHLGVDSAHIIGQSMGGMIAQELALRHAERVRSLVLMCTTPGGPHEAGHDILVADVERGLAIEKIEDAVTPESLQEYALRMFTPEFLKSPGPGFAQMVGAVMQHPQNLDGMKGQAQASRDHDTFDRLPQIIADTLVIAGAGDPWILPENSHILAERIPNAELYIVKGARHGFMAEKPDEVNRVILDFLARREAAAA